MPKPNRHLWLLFAAAGFAAFRCGAASFPAYPAKPPGDYPSCQEHQGIRAAVVPLFDGKEQKRYLGANLLGQGFVPVYLVVENYANTESAIVVRDRLHYGLEDGPAGTAQ